MQNPIGRSYIKWKKDKLINGIRRFIDDHEFGDVLPSYDDFCNHGRKDLASSISNYGGYKKVAKELGLRNKQEANKKWTSFDILATEIEKLVQERAKPGVMPSLEDLRKARLFYPIIELFGGFRAVAKRMGLKIEYPLTAVRQVRIDDQNSGLAPDLLRQMEEAFQNRSFESLDQKYLAVLKLLLINHSFDKARLSFGATKKVFYDCVNFLCDNKILAKDPLRKDFYIVLTELAELLDLNNRSKVNPVVPNLMAQRTYRKLCELHKDKIIFVEVPLCAFIDKETVLETLSTEKIESYYFLQARVDFLICDQNFIPLRVVEYHGGGHAESKENLSTIKNDKRKFALLKAANIPVELISSWDIL